ncbi:MAG: AraC family transcriptional regulator [Butyrivibrio sp.]
MFIPEYEHYHENKVHSASLFPYNTYICSIPLDFKEVQKHWHNEMEIIYIKKGCGIITLDFDTYNVTAGDIVIVVPGQLHGIYQHDSDTMEYENIIFSLNMLLSKHSDSVDSEFFTPLLSGGIKFEHFITVELPYYSDLAACLNRADMICSDFSKGYKLAIKGCLFDFFYILYQNSDESGPVKDNRNLERIKEVIKYIDHNYASDITIEEISAVCGFSSSHFMKFFKNTMGTSFIDYLNDYRLAVASRLLLSSESNIIDIAEGCGYNNLSYFNRIFKKKYGMTPSSYRKVN